MQSKQLEMSPLACKWLCNFPKVKLSLCLTQARKQYRFIIKVHFKQDMINGNRTLTNLSFPEWGILKGCQNSTSKRHHDSATTTKWYRPRMLGGKRRTKSSLGGLYLKKNCSKLKKASQSFIKTCISNLTLQKPIAITFHLEQTHVITDILRKIHINNNSHRRGPKR